MLKKKYIIQSRAEEAAKKWRGLIGASLSEPHTSESNGGFFIYIYIIYYYYYISAVRTYSVNASSTLLTRTLRTPIRAGEKSKTML